MNKLAMAETFFTIIAPKSDESEDHDPSTLEDLSDGDSAWPEMADAGTSHEPAAHLSASLPRPSQIPEPANLRAMNNGGIAYNELVFPRSA
jgi:hypothetical protein